MQSIATSQTAYPAAGLDPIFEVGALPGARTEGWRQRLASLTLVFSDVVLAFLIWEIACLAQIFWAPGYLTGAAVASIVPIALVWVGFRAAQGLYPGYGMDEAEELKRQTYALLATLAFAAIFALAFQIGDLVSRFLLLLVFVGLLFLSPFMRYATKKWMRLHGVWGKPIVILGSGDAAARLEASLEREWGLGFRTVAVFDGSPEGRLVVVREYAEQEPDGSVLQSAVELNRNHRVDTLFLAMPHAPQEYLAGLANLAGVHFRSVVIIPNLAGVGASAVTARNLGGNLGVEMRHNLLNPWVRRTKRALDLGATLVGGIFVLPLLLGLCLLVRLESRGPVFYSAKRMGLDDKLFSCVKFRTMVPDAEAVLQRLLDEDEEAREEYRRYHKLRHDPRVTRVGRFLRKTSLDELPQIWNVLRGEMSLVGPRPYLPRESAEIGRTQGEILRVYPGITGPWQTSGRNDTSFADRVQIDGHYVRNWSIWWDLIILARTVRCVLFSRGAAC
jgi:Undecaprenyl-phosphate galactose phosphotransferase WbaP